MNQWRVETDPARGLYYVEDRENAKRKTSVYIEVRNGHQAEVICAALNNAQAVLHVVQ